MYKFPENLRKRRKALGLKQEGLAVKAHLSTPMISRYETGDTIPRLDVAVCLAKALDISLDELAGIRPKK